MELGCPTRVIRARPEDGAHSIHNSGVELLRYQSPLKTPDMGVHV